MCTGTCVCRYIEHEYTIIKAMKNIEYTNSLQQYVHTLKGHKTNQVTIFNRN